MKVGQFVTSEYSYPTPSGVVYAPLSVVNYITEGLIKNYDYEIDWYAPKGTVSTARVLDYNINPYRTSELSKVSTESANVAQSLFFDNTLLSHLASNAEDYDIIHLHSIRIALPICRVINKPIIMTLHDVINENNLMYLNNHRDLKNVFFVSISEAQKKPAPDLNYISTIHHGVRLDEHIFSPKGGEELIFAGRIVQKKGPDLAINAALSTKLKINLAGPINESDEEKFFYKEKISPLIDNKYINYLGSLSREELFDKYASSFAFLFPLQWEEPFGLTVIESMAAGTPVIAFARGSMPEIIEDGITGFLINPSSNEIIGNYKVKETGIDGIIKALEILKNLDQKNYQIMRKACRSRVEKHFSANSMVKLYNDAYKKAIESFSIS